MTGLTPSQLREEAERHKMIAESLLAAAAAMEGLVGAGNGMVHARPKRTKLSRDERIRAIRDSLVKSRSPLTLTEIVKETGLSYATVHGDLRAAMKRKEIKKVSGGKKGSTLYSTEG